MLKSNTHLRERLIGDVVIGCSVTAVISPMVAIIDKSLVQRSAGTHTLVTSALSSMTSILRDPVAYAKSPTFLWMWATYAATYATCNVIKTLTEEQEHRRSTQRASFDASQNTGLSTGAIFLGTTGANTTACLMKDSAYARLFGTGAHAVPKVSYALWIARDFTVIGSSFVLPDHVAPLVQSQLGVSESTAKTIAQVATPMAAQIVASPLHFLGLDCYNRSLTELSMARRWMERSKAVSSTFGDVLAARMLRILPGYGIAGVWNTKLRNQWREYLVEKEVKHILQATVAF